MPEATCSGEPDAGNPHVRFDEGRGTSVPSYSTGSDTLNLKFFVKWTFCTMY